jgi:hypothetical protein
MVVHLLEGAVATLPRPRRVIHGEIQRVLLLRAAAVLNREDGRIQVRLRREQLVVATGVLQYGVDAHVDDGIVVVVAPPRVTAAIPGIGRRR